MIGDNLVQYTYLYLLNQALQRVPDTFDKREGSIIYDALAPACYELAGFYAELRNTVLNTYALTAANEYLEYRVLERGLTRQSATAAVRKGVFTVPDGSAASVPLGARFTTVDGENSINFFVQSVFTSEGTAVPGSYNLVCEETGTIGNHYSGRLIPITNIETLGTATLTTVVTPARDVETDEELRARYLTAVQQIPFGGNLAQYDAQIKAITGVGEVQIYPVWDGGGTVKCSVIDAEYATISQEFIAQIQNAIDPSPQGTGLGLAPIGHTVTITTPTPIDVDIEATITLQSGYNIGQVRANIENAISTYLLSLRMNWGKPSELNSYELSVYVARINAAILSVAGVANVTNTKINNVAGDLILTQTAATQQLPVIGEVILNV